jgi:hypothetical protein
MPTIGPYMNAFNNVNNKSERVYLCVANGYIAVAAPAENRKFDRDLR